MAIRLAGPQDLLPKPEPEPSVLETSSDLNRAERLAFIFDILSANDAEQRLEIEREIDRIVADYRLHRAVWMTFRDKADAVKWLRKVSGAAADLSHLLGNYEGAPVGSVARKVIRDSTGIDPDRLAVDAERLARFVDGWLPLVRGGKLDQPFADLIDELGKVYQEKTGRAAVISRSSNTGAPSGPFFRLVRCVSEWSGETRTEEAIGSAIHKRNRRPRT